MEQRRRSQKTRLSIAFAIVLLTFTPSLFAASPSVAPSSSTYFVVTDNIGTGTINTFDVFFVRIPASLDPNTDVILAMNSPGGSGTAPDNGYGTGTTSVYVYGGSGAYSNPNAKALSGALATFQTGTQVGTTTTFTNETTGWYPIKTVKPAWGELIGNYYYFKIIVDATSGSIGKNAFQFDVSYGTFTNGTTTPLSGISGVSFFAYSVPYLLENSVTYHLYPFVPYGTAGGSNYLHIANWDIDTTNPGAGTTGNLTSHLGSSLAYSGADLSDNGNWSSNARSLAAAGEDNATWDLAIFSTVSAGTNPAQFWAWVDSSNATVALNLTPPTNQTGLVPIFFSAVSSGPTPDHISTTYGGAAVKANTGATGTVDFSVVDSSGNPVNASIKVYVTLTNFSGASGLIDSSNSSSGAGSINATTALVTTDGFGSGWVKVKSTATGSVTVTPNTDGLNSSTNLAQAVANTTASVTFTSVTPPSASSGSNQSFNIGAGSTAIASLTITENDATGAITNTNGIRIKIPAGLSLQFDTSVTSLAVTGTAQGAGHIAAAPTVTTTSSLMTIPVVSTFGSTQTAILAGIKLMNFSAISSGQLQVSWDGGTTWVSDAYFVTVLDPNQTTWTHGAGTQTWGTAANWSNGVPTGTSNVTIPGGFSATTDYPQLSGVTSLASLSIGSGANIDLQNQNLTVSGTLSNNGTVYLQGTAGQTITLTGGNDVDSGTWNYNGGAAGNVIKDFGAGTDYYNLAVSGTGSISTSAAATIAGDFTVSGGTLSIGHAVSVAGNLSWSGATAVSYTAGSGITLSGSSKTLTPGAAVIASPLTIQAGASYTLGAALSTSATLTVPGSLTSGGFNMSVAGDLDFSTTGSFSHGGATVTMSSSGTGRTLTTNGVTFNNLSLTNGTDTTTLGGAGALNVNGTLTINSNQTLDVGANNFTIATLDNNSGGVLAIDGTQATQTITTMDVAAGAVLYKGTSGTKTIKLTSFYDLIVDSANDSAQTYTLNGNTTVAGALTINYGTLALTTFNLDVTGSAQIGDASAGTPQIGSLTQTAGRFTVGTTTDIDVGSANDLILTTVTNDFGGNVTVESVRDLTLADANGFTFAASTISRDLSLSVAGSLGQSSTFDVGRNTSISTSAAATNIALSTLTNTLAGSIAWSVTGAGAYNNVNIFSDSGSATLGTSASVGGNLTLNFSAAAIDIPNSMSAAGTMTLTAGSGNITDAGSFSAGTLVLTASGSITLDGATNTIGTLGTVQRGGAFTLVDSAGGLTLTGPVTAGTTTNAVSIQTAGGALAVNGNVTATGAGTVSLTGVAVTVAAATTVSGASGVTVNGGTGTLTLNSTSTISSTTTGTITLIADNMVFDTSGSPSVISTGSGAVTLRPSTNSQQIYAGTGASGLGLTNAEINRVTTTGTLHIGLAATTTGNVHLDGGITTTGTKSLSFETTGSISVDATLTVDTSAGGAATFDAPVDASGSFGLTVNGTGSAVAFNYAIGGGGGPPTSLNISGSTTLSLKAVTTSGAQTYTASTSSSLAGTLTVNATGSGVSFTGPVLLSAGGGTITLTGTSINNDVTFSGTSTIDNAQALSITATGGDVSFGAAVGGTALTSIAVTANTVTTTASITTTSTQNYTATTFTFNPGAGGLTVQTNNADVTFSGQVVVSGTGTSSISISGPTASTPTIDLSGGINFTVNQMFLVNATGAPTSVGVINVGTVTTTATNQGTFNVGYNNTTTPILNGTVVLKGNIGTSGLRLANFRTATATVLNTSISIFSQAVLRFVNTIDGTAATENLTLDTAGTLTVSNNVGSGTRIAKLDLTGGTTLNFGNAVNPAGPFTWRTADTVTTHNTVTMNQGITINSSFANKDITFNGTVTGGQTLSLNPGTGNVTMSLAVGTPTPLTSFTVSNATSVSLAAVTTTGAQSYTAGTGVTVNGSLTTTGAGGTISFLSSTPVVMGAAGLTLDTSASSSAISFGGTVNATGAGIQGMTLNLGTGTATASAAWGLGQALGPVVITGGTLALADTNNSFGSSITGTGTLNASGMSSTRTLTISGNVGSAGTALGALSTPTSGSISMSGAVWNVGTYTSNTENISYAGGAGAVIYSSSNFYNLTTTGIIGYNGVAALNVSNNLTVTSGTLTLVNASGTIGGNLAIGGTLNASAIAGANTLTITGVAGTSGTPLATLTAPAGTMSVAGATWNVTTFNHSSGTVAFTNAAPILYSGNTFFKLNFVTVGQSVTFPAGLTTSIFAGGLFTVTGNSLNIIALKSSSAGTKWNFNNAGGVPAVSFADIVDGGVLSAATITVSSSHDGGNNDAKWIFGPTAMTWGGTVSPVWTASGNWTPRFVPNVTDNVTIPGAVPNNPIPPAALTVNDLIVNGTLNNSVSNTITVNGNLQVSGTWQTPANSTVVMQTNAATINSTATLGNLTISPGAGNSVLISTNALTISGNLAVTGTATFNMNGRGLAMSAGGQLSGTVTNTGVAATFNASGGAVTLVATASVTTNGGTLSFGSVTAQSAGSENLTLNSGAGTMTLGTIGATALGDLSLTTTVALALPSITLAAGHDLSVTSGTLTQQATTSLSVGGTTTINTGAGADATLTNSGNTLTGALTVTNSKIFQLASSALTIASATVAGAGSFTVVSSATVTTTGAISNGGGASTAAISLTGDDFVIGAAITAGAAAVTFTTATAGQNIYIGGGGTAAGLSQAELNNVTTTGTLTLGDSLHTGTIQTDNSLVFTNPSGPVQFLTRGGNIILNNAVTTVGNLTLDSTQGGVTSGAVTGSGLLTIGAAGAANLTVTAGAGINLSNAGNLATIFFLTNQNGSGNIVAQANRNTSVRGSNLVAGGSFTFTNNTGTLATANSITTTGAGSAFVKLTTPGLMTLANAVTAGGTGYVSLNSAGVNQTGGTISAGNGLELVGTGTFTLTQNNTVGKLAANVTGDVSYTDTGALSIDTVNATSTFTTSTSNNTTLSSGALSQVNPITTATLTLTSSGTITLTNGSNNIAASGTISRGGAFQLTDNAVALAINGNIGGTTTNAVTISNTGSVSINANVTTTLANDISISGVTISVTGSPTVSGGSGLITINGGGGSISLGSSTLSTSNNTASAITVHNATSVTLGNVTASGGASARLKIGSGADVSSTVTQSGATIINVGTGGVAWSTNSTVALGNSNTIAILDVSTSNGTSAVVTNSALSVSGNVSTTNGDLSLTATGITIAANIGTGTGNLILLPSASGASQSAGALTVTGLRVVGTGAVSLNQASNSVATFAANTSGGAVSLTVTGALSVGTVGATTGIQTTNQNLTLSSTGALTISQTITTNAGSVYLTAAGATQSAQITTTAGLRLAGTGVFTLSDTSNSLTSLAIGVTGATSIYSVGAVNIGTVAAGTGVSIGSNNLTFDGTGAWTQSGGADISASGLQLLGTGSYTFTNAGNAISVLAGNVTNNVSLTTGAALSIGTVSTVGLAANNVTLGTSGGTLSQTQALVSSGILQITAGTQTVDLTGSASNNFTSVTIVSSGTISLTDTNGYTVNSASAVAGNLDFTDTTGTITIGGTVATTGTATQNIHPGGTGDLQVNGSFTTVNGTVTLNPAGTVFANVATLFNASGTGGLTVSRPVSLQAATSSITGSGGTITFGASATINGTNNLTVAASTGDVSFGAAIGGSTVLGTITVSSAVNVTTSSTLNAGSVSITNSGVLSVADVVSVADTASDWTLSGTFTHSGTGTLNISGDIATTLSSGTGLTLNRPTTLSGAVRLATGNSNIVFGASATVDATGSGVQALTIVAGTGTVTVGAGIGGGTPLGTIQVNSAVLNLSGSNLITSAATQTYTVTTDILMDPSAAGTIASGGATIRFDTPSFYLDDTGAAGAITVSDDLLFEDAATPTAITRNVYLYKGNWNVSNRTLTIKGSLVLLGAAFNEDDVDRGGSAIEFRYPLYATMITSHAVGTTGMQFAAAAAGLAGTTLIVNGNFYANGISLNPTSNWTLKIPTNDTIAGLTAAGSGNGFGTGTGAGSYFAAAFYSTIAHGQVDPVSGTSEAVVAASSSNTVGTDLSLQTNNADTDGGSNEVPTLGNNWQGWAFNAPYIVSVKTIYDNMIEVKFSQPLENGNGEIPAALTTGLNFLQSPRFNVAAGSQRFTKVYRYNTPATNGGDTNGNGFIDSTEITQISAASSDFGDSTDPIILWIDPSIATWNTDATGSTTGNAASTDRNGVHQTRVVSVDVLKGLFFAAHGKNLLPNYGNNSMTRFVSTTDATGPVLVGVYAGRSPYNQDHLAMPINQSAMREYDGHNFLHFRYSEPVSFTPSIAVMADNGTGSAQTGIPNTGATSVVRSTSTFGEVTTTAGTVQVAGLIQFPAGAGSGIEEGGRNTGDHKGVSANADLIVRTTTGTENPSGTLGITLFLRGYSFTAVDPVDSLTKRYWPGWARNPNSTTAGITNPVSINPVVLANSGIVDAAGNILEPSSAAPGVAISPRIYDNAGAFKISSSIGAVGFSTATSTALDDAAPPPGRFYQGWDVDPPVFTKPTASTNYDLITKTDPTFGFLNTMEIHIQDDSAAIWNKVPATSPPYHNPLVPAAISNDGNSPDGYVTPGVQDRIIGGIRDTSWNFPEAAEGAANYLNEMLAFKIEDRNVEGNASFPPRNDQNASLTSSVNNTDFGGSVGNADDPYFALTIGNASNPWGSLSNMYMQYDENVGYLTDHAGNLLRSKTSIYAVERTPPFVELSLAVVGKRRIYLQFNEPVFGNAANTAMIAAGSFTISGGASPPTISGLTKIDGISGKPLSITKAYLDLNRDLTADDIYQLKVTVAASAVFDQSQNAMISGVSRSISDVGIGTVAPVYAVDDIVNPGTAAQITPVRDFSGNDSLSGLSTIQIQVQNATTAFLSLPVKLYYDVNVAAASLYNSSFWYPQSIPGMYLPIDPNARGQATAVAADLQARSVLGTAGSNGLTTFRIVPGDSEIKAGAMLDFVLEAGGLPTATVTDPNDPTSLRPWRLGIGGLVEQRGGVTILNNVINPTAGDKTILVVDLKKAGIVNVVVFTLDGSIVKVLQRNRLGAGNYTFSWDGTNGNNAIVARGLYMIRVTGPDIDEFRKVLVVKP